MRKRTKKFSLGIKIISLLACVAIMSVGFASWLIIKMPETTTVDGGSFTVYEVEDKTVNFGTISWVNNKSAITFGKPAGYQAKAGDWLVPQGLEDENLSATFYFDVTVNSGNLSDVVDKLTIQLGKNDALNTAITSNYVAAPTFKVYLDNTAAATSASGLTATATGTYNQDNTSVDVTMSGASASKVRVFVEITFAWGSAFGATSTNPYTYYNALTHAAQAANAKTALQAIYGLNGAKYEFTLSATAKAVA